MGTVELSTFNHAPPNPPANNCEGRCGDVASDGRETEKQNRMKIKQQKYEREMKGK